VPGFAQKTAQSVFDALHVGKDKPVLVGADSVPEASEAADLE
jgi:hypothetical protein